MVVFTTGFRLNLTSKVSIDFFYVFTLTEINNSHNIVGRLLMSWLTSMFSSFSLTYKNSKLAASSSDFEGCENLTSPAFARVNLLKVSVSEYFLSQFLGHEGKIDFYQFTITKQPLFFFFGIRG